MVVKCSLFFRRFEVRKNENNEDYLQVYFLDENDTKYCFNFPFNEENKKYMKMSKDVKCDFDLVLYTPKDLKNAKYNFYVK